MRLKYGISIINNTNLLLNNFRYIRVLFYLGFIYVGNY